MTPFNLNDYRVPSKVDRFFDGLAEGLIKVYEKLGRPPADLDSPIFWLMIDNIVQVWSKIFPEEVKDLAHDVELDRALEQSLSESVKKGWKQSLKFPPHMFSMIKTMFPELIVTDRKFVDKMIHRYPFLNSSNYT